MATYNWLVYFGGEGDPVDIDVNTLVFSGDPSDLAVAINVDQFNDGTHLGSGDPGNDMCGNQHIFNVKYGDITHFYGGGSTTSETINNSSLPLDHSTIVLKFTNASEVEVSAGRFFCFDGTTETVEAIGILAYAVETAVGESAWTKINDDLANYGGNNTGELLSLIAHTTASTQHFWGIAISVSPQSYGPKTQFDFGVELTYS